MRRLALSWRRIKSDTIQGINELLPDNQCFFEIQKLENERYFIKLAGRTIENSSHKIIVDCPQLARKLCEDYLNDNIKQIVKNQAKDIKRKYIKSERPAQYYELFLDKFG